MENRKPQQSRLTKPMNAFMKAMSRIGIAPGPVHILSVPGRNTGKMRATPVSPFELAGQRYVLAGVDDADWVQNVRAAGWAELRRGRRAGVRVRMVEVPVDQRPPMLRAYGENIPGGSMLFQRFYGISGDSDSFASLKHVCPVFRIEQVAV